MHASVPKFTSLSTPTTELKPTLILYDLKLITSAKILFPNKVEFGVCHLSNMDSDFYLLSECLYI